MAALTALNQRVTACRRCPRLVEWRELVAREKRASFRDEDYWGRPGPGFGDPAAGVGVRRPPGAGRARDAPTRPGACTCSDWRPPRTAATAPAACSPATARATGC